MKKNAQRWLLSGLLLATVQLAAIAQLVKEEHGDLRLLFTGDIMGHDSQINSAFDVLTGSYDYNPVFKYVRPVLESHDVVIGNLEVTLAGRPYQGYPRFSSPAALASAARDAGIRVMVTANNHSVDRGLAGINSTLDRLDSLGIIHTGTYRSAAERDSVVPCIIEKNGIRLALLNYTYGTNGIKVPYPAVVDHIDRGVIEADIRAAEVAGVDGTIAFLHWGNEYDTLPSGHQKELAQWLFEQGVMMVIGSHPHVIQPAVFTAGEGAVGDRLVAYSLGNFVSNQRNRRTDGGMMLSVTLSWDGGSLRITDSGYILTWVYSPLENGLRRFYILPAATFEENELIPDVVASGSLMKIFLSDSRRLLNYYENGIKEYIFATQQNGK